MKKMILSAILFTAAISLSACMQGASSGQTSDACGASQFQNLVGGPSSAVRGLKIPGASRHYGSKERVATNKKSRLNFVHSGAAIESVTDPKSTITRVFCG